MLAILHAHRVHGLAVGIDIEGMLHSLGAVHLGQQAAVVQAAGQLGAIGKVDAAGAVNLPALLGHGQARQGQQQAQQQAQGGFFIRVSPFRIYGWAVARSLSGMFSNRSFPALSSPTAV